MKKHNSIKVILVVIMILAVLSWIIPAAYFQTELVEEGRLRMGLFDLFNYPVTALSYFGYIALFILVVGGFYGILYRIPAYRKLLDKIVDNLKGNEKLFLIVAIPMGILYCFLNPLGKVPDEDIHVRRAMAIASGNLFSHANEKGEASDEFDKKLDDLVNRDIYSYQDLKNRIGIEENGEKEQMGYTTLALYFPICHLPQVVGILIARLFNLNLVVQCYLGRLVNLFVSPQPHLAHFLLYLLNKYVFI